MVDSDQKYPEGHFTGLWIGIGVAVGAGLGVPMAIVLGNMAFIGLGMPIGIAIGAAIGTSQEARHKAEGKIRPLRDSEKEQQKILRYVGLALLLVGFLVLLGILILR